MGTIGVRLGTGAVISAAVGPPPTFSPTDVPGIQLWIEADMLTGLADGDPVGTWADASGNADDATATGTARLNYHPAVIGGKPILRSSGSPQGMALASPIVLSGSFAIYSVGKRDAGATYLPLGGATGYAAVQLFFDDNYYIMFDDTLFVSGGGDSDVGPFALGWERQSDGSMAVYKGGVLAYAYPTTNAGSVMTLNSVGYRPATGTYSVGDIAAVLCYAPAPSADDRALIFDYFSSKYSV